MIKYIRCLAALSILLAFTVMSFAQDGKVTIRGFEMRTGDILFQAFEPSGYASAIESVSDGWGGYAFSHVGVAYIENGNAFVLEAIPYGVSKTPIETFLRKSRQINGRPAVAVARLKKKYRKAIPDAISTMLSLIGKRYDFVFDPSNDMYYCSEIIEIAFRHRNKPIFDSAPMSFKDKQSGELNPYWIKHFEMHKGEIPEGVPGTNPSDMSKSPKLKIIHTF